MCIQLPFGTYSEVLASSKPWTKAVGGLFCAGVLARANIEHTVVAPGVAAKEGIGKGGLSASCGSNYNDPGVGKVGDKRPLALGERNHSQEEMPCPHGDETNTTDEGICTIAQDKQVTGDKVYQN